MGNPQPSFIKAGCFHTAPATNPGLDQDRPTLVPYLVLLQVGLAKPVGHPTAGALLPTPFHPYHFQRKWRYLFCGAFRGMKLSFHTPGCYPAPWPVAVRTFLSLKTGFAAACGSDGSL